MELPLVPNRECGECKVCCEELPIDNPEIQRGPRVTCVNYKDGCGCAIYETRPNVCRSFHCGWRMLPQLDESWRPSKIGVMINFKKSGIPAHYEADYGVEFLLLDLAAIHNKDVVEVIVRSIAGGLPTFLALAGPKGMQYPSTLISDFMRDAVASGNAAQITAALMQAFETLKAHPLQPYPFHSVALPGVVRQE